MTTGTQEHNHNGDAGEQGGYINDDGDTGNVRLAITINKAQGQSLEKCGIDLNTDCFSHGQLYVACSRVGMQWHSTCRKKNNGKPNRGHNPDRAF